MSREVKRWITVNGKHIPVYEDDNSVQDKGLLSFEKDNPKITKWIEKAFDKANLQGEDVDLWEIIYSYKAFQNLTDEQQEELYDYLAERLGFTR